MAELFLMAAATTVEHLLSPGVLGVLRRGRGGGDGGTRFGVEPASAPCDIDAAHCTADGHYDAVPRVRRASDHHVPAWVPVSVEIQSAGVGDSGDEQGRVWACRALVALGAAPLPFCCSCCC